MFTLLQAVVMDTLNNIVSVEVVKPTFWEKLLPMLKLWGLKLLVAIIIFIIGKWIAGGIKNVIKKRMLKSGKDATLANFLSSIIFFLVMLFVIIAAIAKIGIQTASLVAIIGGAGLAIGLALQGSLANFAGGVMLILFHPFKVGDTITGAGQTGKVHEIQMFSTIMIGEENKVIFIPNAKLSNDVIVNAEGPKVLER
ncbi:MAG: mechanosensitive ion channel [Candidatus Cloacimonadaceae bacterium]